MLSDLQQQRAMATKRQRLMPGIMPRIMPTLAPALPLSPRRPTERPDSSEEGSQRPKAVQRVTEAVAVGLSEGGQTGPAPSEIVAPESVGEWHAAASVPWLLLPQGLEHQRQSVPPEPDSHGERALPLPDPGVPLLDAEGPVQGEPLATTPILVSPTTRLEDRVASLLFSMQPPLCCLLVLGCGARSWAAGRHPKGPFGPR